MPEYDESKEHEGGKSTDTAAVAEGYVEKKKASSSSSSSKKKSTTKGGKKS